MATTTYDSGGTGSLPNGGDPDYSSLSTWEAATDVALSAIEYLDCYDSVNPHVDGNINISGATGTGPTVYRHIRSAADCRVPFNGTKDSGANFSPSTVGTAIFNSFTETDLRIENISMGGVTENDSFDLKGIDFGSPDAKAINCVFWDIINTGSGYGIGIFIDENNAMAYNCIAYGCNIGFRGQAGGGNHGFICCTAIDNTHTGFHANNVAATTTVFSCMSQNNGTNDYREQYFSSTTSDYNLASDTTADLGGAATNYINDTTVSLLDDNGLATKDYTSYWATAGINPYNNLSATNDFDDFLRNDTAGDASFSKDIAGNPRPKEDTADVHWTPGASQAVSPYGEAENRVTYDSGGANSLPDGSSPDYSSLTTWEAATDIAMTTYGRYMLVAFDSQDHDNAVQMAGVSSVGADSYRGIRSSEDCVTPFNGTFGSGATFWRTAIHQYVLMFTENYPRLERLCLKTTASNTSNTHCFTTSASVSNGKVVSCIAANSSNPNTGVARGFVCSHSHLIYNCVSHNNEGNGFQLSAGSGLKPSAINCSAYDNGGYGFEATTSSGTNTAFNCVAKNNTSGDFSETSANWGSVSGYNLASDATADLGGGATNYENSGLFTLTNGHMTHYTRTLWLNAGMSNYNNMGIVNDYGNWLRNDQDGDVQWKYDMIGNLRPNESVADARWTPGPVQVNDEYGRNNTSVTLDTGGTGSLPNGGDPTYSSPTTAEADWDIDLAGYERVVVDVFDSQTHTTNYYATGASSLTGTTYRVIRSSPACAKPFDGRDGYGAKFSTSSIYGSLQFGEDYGSIEKLTAIMSQNSSGQAKAIALGGAHTKALFCRAKATNSGTGNGNGYRNTGNYHLAYGCLAYDCDNYGFYMNGTDGSAICCTVVGTVGGVGAGFCPFSATNQAFSCYGADNNTDFRDDAAYWGSWSDYNTSSDTSADLGGESTNYNHSISLEYTDGIITEENSYGRNPYNDVSATIDFNDILRNDTAGYPEFKYDLVYDLRPNESVADASWGTGANQFYTFPVITFIPRVTWIL